MTYYELLGISPAASVQEIRDAYRDMLRIFHPDSNYYTDIIDDRPHTRHIDTFLKISTAYEVLKNPVKRVRYDECMLIEVDSGPSPDSQQVRPAPPKNNLLLALLTRLNSPLAPFIGLALGVALTALVLCFAR